MQDDEFAQLRGSVRRSQNLRVAPQPPHPRVVEPFAPLGMAPPEPRRLGFWQITLRAIPIVAALVSTSLLVYFMFFGDRGAPYAQLQQGSREVAPQVERQPVQEKESAQGQQERSPEQLAQVDKPRQQPTQPPVPTDLGPRLPMPTDDKLVVLITASVLALNQANATGNYSVLHDSSAPAFQQRNSPERLAQIFSSLRARNLDLSPVVLFTPRLFRAPEMNAQGMLRITGFFPTEPERVNFDLIYQPVQGQWRLYGIAVETGAVKPPPGGAQRRPQSAPSAAEPAKKSSESNDTDKPPVPPRKAKPKPKAAEDVDPDSQGSELEAKASNPSFDVRDRIEQSPAAPPPERPKQKGIWNPFGR